MVSDSRTRWWLVALLLLAFALRVGIGFACPASDYPDEIFQTREPAHHLAFGYGIVTWEFRDGIRNWVFPGFLAGIMRATHWMGPGALGYDLGILLVLSAISLSVVATGFWWGWRIGGLTAAIITAAACALWYELIYYAPQALTEVIAAHLLAPGLYFACFPAAPAASPEGSSTNAAVIPDFRRLFLGGLLLGSSLMLRIHLLPAVVLALLLTCRLDARKWKGILAGLAVPILIFGLVDWPTWGAPFASYWRSITINVFHHKSSSYGVEPAGWFFLTSATHFGPIAVLLVAGWRRATTPTLVALTIFATHSAFGHKEYRFIYPAIPLLCILAGIGVAALFANPHRPRWLASERARAAAAVLLIAVASGIWGMSYGLWTERVGLVQSFQELSLRHDVCGVGVDDAVRDGGYAHLHHDVPLYTLDGYWPHDPSLFNYVTAHKFNSAKAPGYSALRCWGDFCLYRRPGTCATAPGYNINETLRQAGR